MLYMLRWEVDIESSGIMLLFAVQGATPSWIRVVQGKNGYPDNTKEWTYENIYK